MNISEFSMIFLHIKGSSCTAFFGDLYARVSWEHSDALWRTSPDMNMHETTRYHPISDCQEYHSHTLALSETHQRRNLSLLILYLLKMYLVFSVSVCMEWDGEGSKGKLQTETIIRCDVRMIGHDVRTHGGSGHQDVPGQGKLLRESDVEVEAFKTDGTSLKMREIKWLKN